LGSGIVSIDAASSSFYAGALTRISRIMVLLACVSALTSLTIYGWRIAVGVFVGSLIAYVNFHWMKQVVNALAERSIESQGTRPGKGIVLRFLVRYALMALVGYVIFSASPASLYGLFAGLFLPVAAIACEAAYEAYVALARGL
jgi:uncharacterized membrane protein